MTAYRSYFTRHMPVDLHERLHALTRYRNATNGAGPSHTLEETINEAIARGLESLEDQYEPIDPEIVRMSPQERQHALNQIHTERINAIVRAPLPRVRLNWKPRNPAQERNPEQEDWDRERREDEEEE